MPHELLKRQTPIGVYVHHGYMKPLLVVPAGVHVVEAFAEGTKAMNAMNRLKARVANRMVVLGMEGSGSEEHE
jgi:hypothetical protein